MQGSKQSGGRVVSPWLNIFWLFLFFPVVLILYLLWYQKLPWLNEMSEDQPDRGGAPPRPDWFSHRP